MARLRLFAALREAAGRDRDTIDAPTLEALLDEARSRYGPEFAELLDSAAVVVNGERVGPGASGAGKLADSDEVALLPPVSGGEDAAAPVLAGPSALPGILAGIFGLIAVLMSAVGPGAFAVFLAASLAYGVMELSRIMGRGGLHLAGPAAAVAALVFVAAALRWGEGSFLVAAAAVLAGAGAFYVLRGVRPAVTEQLSVFMFASAFTGFLGSYAVLIRRSEEGERLILALALMVAFYYVGRWLGGARLRSSPSGGGLGPLLIAAGAGVAGCIVAALVGSYILGLAAGPGAVVALGVIVGVACVIGNMMGALMRASLGMSLRRATLPGSGGMLMQLETVLLAAPAFFYGFRLYLT